MGGKSLSMTACCCQKQFDLCKIINIFIKLKNQYIFFYKLTWKHYNKLPFAIEHWFKVSLKWSNLIKFMVNFNQIWPRKSNLIKFNFQIWDMKFENSKFEWSRMNSSELSSKDHCEWPKFFFFFVKMGKVTNK